MGKLVLIPFDAIDELTRALAMKDLISGMTVYGSGGSGGGAPPYLAIDRERLIAKLDKIAAELAAFKEKIHDDAA